MEPVSTVVYELRYLNQISEENRIILFNPNCLLLKRKAMTNLDRILKSRDITLPTKVHIVKAMVFPVVMYRELDHNED